MIMNSKAALKRSAMSAGGPVIKVFFWHIHICVYCNPQKQGKVSTTSQAAVLLPKWEQSIYCMILCIVTNHLYTVISFVILLILPSELKAINYPHSQAMW